MPALDRVAVISDVHGNLTALEAVLADIDARGLRRVLNLGDSVGKGPRGAEVVSRCAQACEVNLLGNWDDFLPDPARSFDSEALAWWLEQLAPGQGEWLRSRPFSHDLVMSGRRIRLFHASPTSVHHRVRFDHDGDEFAAMFANSESTGDRPQPSVVVYGDIHDAYYEVGPDRRTLVNAGSVGNSMGDPTPVYVVLEGVLDGPDQAPLSVQFVRVPYDVEAELAVARAMGMPELDSYELELRKGVYRGHLRTGSEPGYHRRRR